MKSTHSYYDWKHNELVIYVKKQRRPITIEENDIFDLNSHWIQQFVNAFVSFEWFKLGHHYLILTICGTKCQISRQATLV